MWFISENMPFSITPLFWSTKSKALYIIHYPLFKQGKLPHCKDTRTVNIDFLGWWYTSCHTAHSSICLLPKAIPFVKEERKVALCTISCGLQIFKRNKFLRMKGSFFWLKKKQLTIYFRSIPTPSTCTFQLLACQEPCSFLPGFFLK